MLQDFASIEAAGYPVLSWRGGLKSSREFDLRTYLVIVLFAALALSISNRSNAQESQPVKMYAETANGLVLTAEGASHFARLALDCIHKEYPNKLSQTLESAEFLLPPSELHPAFYGCYDWHSSVHGHWMLVKLLREFPNLAERGEIVAGLTASINPANIVGEVAYFAHESGSWERMYGWSWLLQLALEVEAWQDPVGERLAVSLGPLTRLIRDKYIEFLPRQEYPIRHGVHPNTAFGLSFALDYARAAADTELAAAITAAALRYYSEDRGCPLGWEPSGADFLSPCLEEAALMARVIDGEAYLDWLRAFLPGLFGTAQLTPANVSDRSDPQIVHLDGLNLSRAWDLYIIADVLPGHSDTRRLRGWAARHLEASLPHVASEHYEGSHWLGSFAVYALTRNRGE
jgi:hypothetical protein